MVDSDPLMGNRLEPPSLSLAAVPSLSLNAPESQFDSPFEKSTSFNLKDSMSSQVVDSPNQKGGANANQGAVPNIRGSNGRDVREHSGGANDSDSLSAPRRTSPSPVSSPGSERRLPLSGQTTMSTGGKPTLTPSLSISGKIWLESSQPLQERVSSAGALTGKSALLYDPEEFDDIYDVVRAPLLSLGSCRDRANGLGRFLM